MKDIDSVLEIGMIESSMATTPVAPPKKKKTDDHQDAAVELMHNNDEAFLAGEDIAGEEDHGLDEHQEFEKHLEDLEKSERA